MKNNNLESIISKILAKKKYYYEEIFESIRDSKEKVVSKKFYDVMKDKILERYFSELETCKEEIKKSHLKKIIKQFKREFNFDDYRPDINTDDLDLLREEIIANLKQELKLLKGSKTKTQHDPIQIKCDNVILYALFQEIGNELFASKPSNHRISQLISENFINKDGKAITQKSCYNKIKNGSSENAIKNLNEILTRITKKRIK